MFLGASLRFNFIVLLCLAPLAGACSSMDEDTPDHVDLILPRTDWTFSTFDSQWRASPPAGSIPKFVCAGPQALDTDCCARPWDCQRYPLACDPTLNLCTLTFEVQVAGTVDLREPVAAIPEGQRRVFSKVEVIDLVASVEITADLPVRSLALFIGPPGLADSSDPTATMLTPLGMGPGPQTLSPGIAARNALSVLARNYVTPFTVLLTAHAIVPDGFGSEGGLSASLDGKLRAYY
jgi:hypothetical protein